MHLAKDWLVRCGSCGFLESNLEAGPGTGITGLKEIRTVNFGIILDRLQDVTELRGRDLLEAGSAWGYFLRAARNRGCRVRGIEPERANAEICRKQGLDVEIGLFPKDLKNRGPYDILVFNDVFEHIPKPDSIIAEMEGLLRPGGLLVINLPSSDGVLYRAAQFLDRLGFCSPFQRLWQMDFPSPHVSYFNPRNLDMLIWEQSNLMKVLDFTLPSVSRRGLWDRIGVSHRGPLRVGLFAAVWCLSFFLPLLPADIHVALYKKPSAPSPTMRRASTSSPSGV